MDLNLKFNKFTQQSLKKLGVNGVYLFGSHAEGLAQKGSDIDLAVLFFNPIPEDADTREIYQKLFEIFSDHFGQENLDIALLDRADLELKFDVISHGRVIFEVSADERYAFEERIHLLCADFYPILQEMNKAILKRL